MIKGLARGVPCYQRRFRLAVFLPHGQRIRRRVAGSIRGIASIVNRHERVDKVEAFVCLVSTGLNTPATILPKLTRCRSTQPDTSSTAKKFAAAESLVKWLSTGSTGGGIGSCSGGGVGSGRGPGLGPGWGGEIGGGVYRAGGVTAPRLIYGPEPEFSEEARKARFQGTVVLWLVVGPDGRTHDIRVQQSLGMGLDEKAIEAIRQCLTRVARME